MKRILSILLSFLLICPNIVLAESTASFNDKDTLNIVFLGGSITEGVGASSYKANEVNYMNKDGSIVFADCYAGIVGSWFKEEFADKTVNIYNSGIGGTDSKVGLFRLRDEVICYNPDIVFVEFAVNDRNVAKENAAYMEAIVRELSELENPPIINFIYTTTEEFKTAREEQSKVAKYYGIPEHDLQSVVENEVKSGKVKVRELLGDGTHPTNAGHKLYADTIIKNLKTGNYYKRPEIKEETLSKVSFDSPRIENVKNAESDGNWYFADTNGRDTYITTGIPGATLKYKFYGTRIGLLLSCGIKGSADVSIDGGKPTTATPYGAMMNLNYYQEGLENGEHTIEIKVKANSNGNVGLGICGFVVDGYSKDEESDSKIEDIEKYSKTIYVSTSGNDSNPGTESEPLKTVEKAKNIASAMVKNSSGDVNIIIREGRYNLGKGLVFNNEDSGRKEAKITFKAYENEEVVFTNSQKISSELFKAVTDEETLKRIPEQARGKVYEVDISATDITDVGFLMEENMGMSGKQGNGVGRRMLVEGNNLYTIARWPNDGFASIAEIVQTTSGHRFKYSENKGDSWETVDQAWVYGYFMYLWADHALAISDIDCENRIISTSRTHNYGMKKDTPYFIYNLLEELDVPGEWFLDANTKKLYVFPKKDIKDCEFYFAGRSENLVTLKNANYIGFENIIFEDSCADALFIDGGDYNRIEGCVIRNMGHHAVDIVDGTHNSILNSHIYDIGRGGIFIVGGDFVNLTPSENIVKNCHIERYALNGRTYSPAVKLNGVGDIVSHNEINNASHMAIAFQGNDNIIEYNEIHDVLKYTSDMGAIYAGRSWINGGTVIRHNYIHDCKGEGFRDAIWFTQGVYLDDGFYDVEIYGNIFDGLNNGIFTHFADYVTIENNIFNDCVNAMEIIIPGGADAARMEEYKKTFDTVKAEEKMDTYNELNFQTLYTNYLNFYNPESNVWNEKYPYLKEVLNSYWMVPTHNVIKKNIIYACEEEPIAIDKYIEEYTISENNYVDEKAVENGNYLKSADNVEGFEKIDLSGWGIENSEKVNVGTFGVIYPYNGAENVNVADIMLLWEKADGADTYRVTIAEDEKFEKIVYDDVTNKNHITLPRLKFNYQKYYWKVGASSNAKRYTNEIIYSNEGIMSFRSAGSEKIYTDELKKTIENAEKSHKSAVEGTNPGEYKEGTKLLLSESISKAKDVMNKKQSISPYISRQVSIDSAENNLKKQLEKFNASRNAMTVDISELLSNSDGWYRKNGAMDVKGESATFEGAGNFGYTKGKLESYKRLKFNLSYDMIDEASWFCFELRSQSLSVVPWATQCYIFLVKKDVLEVQKFNGSETFYYTLENDVLSDGKMHEVEIGTVREENGVRVTLLIDGIEKFNFLDETAPITDEGYFGVYIAGKSNIKLTPAI